MPIETPNILLVKQEANEGGSASTDKLTVLNENLQKIDDLFDFGSLVPLGMGVPDAGSGEKAALLDHVHPNEGQVLLNPQITGGTLSQVDVEGTITSLATAASQVFVSTGVNSVDVLDPPSGGLLALLGWDASGTLGQIGLANQVQTLWDGTPVAFAADASKTLSTGGSPDVTLTTDFLNNEFDEIAFVFIFGASAIASTTRPLITARFLMHEVSGILTPNPNLTNLWLTSFQENDNAEEIRLQLQAAGSDPVWKLHYNATTDNDARLYRVYGLRWSTVQGEAPAQQPSLITPGLNAPTQEQVFDLASVIFIEGTNISLTKVDADNQITVSSTEPDYETGSSFPANPNTNDLFNFNADVASGLTCFDYDGTTALTSAERGDLFKYSGSVWVKQSEAGLDALGDLATLTPLAVTDHLVVTDASDSNTGKRVVVTDLLEASPTGATSVNTSRLKIAGTNYYLHDARFHGAAATDPGAGVSTEGDLFYNTTSDVLKSYDGSAWVVVQGSTASAIPVQDTAPTSPSEGDLWVDTAGTTTVLKVYTGTAWQATSSTGKADTDLQNIDTDLTETEQEVVYTRLGLPETSDTLDDVTTSGGYTLTTATTHVSGSLPGTKGARVVMSDATDFSTATGIDIGVPNSGDTASLYTLLVRAKTLFAGSEPYTLVLTFSDSVGTKQFTFQVSGFESGANPSGALNPTWHLSGKISSFEGFANFDSTRKLVAELRYQHAELTVEDGTLTTAKYADGSVTTAKIAANAVTAAKIEDGAVTAAKYADGSLTTGKIGSSAVTTAKINSNAVTAAKIATDAVTETEIEDAAVTTAKIADDAVTLAKMAGGTGDKYLGYDASGDPAEKDAPSGGGGGSIPAQDTAPASPSEGDLWVDTTGDTAILKVREGTAWVSQASKDFAEDVVAAEAPVQVSWHAGTQGDPTDATLTHPATTFDTANSTYDATNERWPLQEQNNLGSSLKGNLYWTNEQHGNWGNVAIGWGMERVKGAYFDFMFYGVPLANLPTTQASLEGGHLIVFDNRDNWKFHMVCTSDQGDNNNGVFDVESFNGAAPDQALSSTGRNSIELPSSFSTVDEIHCLLLKRGASVLFFVDGTHYVTWTLTATEAATTTGPCFGFSANAGNAVPHALYLNDVLIGNADVVDLTDSYRVRDVPEVPAATGFYGIDRASGKIVSWKSVATVLANRIAPAAGGNGDIMRRTSGGALEFVGLTVSTAVPSSGSNGDFWFQREA